MVEIECRECGKWSVESDWTESEVPCEDCGAHPAMKCPHCNEGYDTVSMAWAELRTRPAGLAQPPQPPHRQDVMEFLRQLTDDPDETVRRAEQAMTRPSKAQLQAAIEEFSAESDEWGD